MRAAWQEWDLVRRARGQAQRAAGNGWLWFAVMLVGLYATEPNATLPF